MPSSILFVGLSIISFIDLANINSRYHKKYSDIDKLQQQYFRETQTDHFINSDKDIFRIMPVGNLFSDNRWAAYHQTIGGYSPIKMYTIEELIQNNLYKGWDKKMPINWNVLQTLNVKYLIFQNENIVHKKLKLVYSDKANNLYTYQYLDYLPRGYFVENYKIIQDEFARLAALNDSLFNPEKTAILEEDLETSVSISDSNYSKILSFDPNGSSYEVYTDHTVLFVISELFYPPGWEIAIDAKQVQKIYKTNHAVQSIIVPAGKHKIDVLFKPESYFRSLRLASTSLSTIYIIIIVSLLLTHKEKIRKLIAKK